MRLESQSTSDFAGAKRAAATEYSTVSFEYLGVLDFYVALAAAGSQPGLVYFFENSSWALIPLYYCSHVMFHLTKTSQFVTLFAFRNLRNC